MVLHNDTNKDIANNQLNEVSLAQESLRPHLPSRASALVTSTFGLLLGAAGCATTNESNDRPINHSETTHTLTLNKDKEAPRWLSSVLSPRSESYYVEGQEVSICPMMEFVAIRADRELKNQDVASIINTESLEGDFGAEVAASPSGSSRYYVVLRKNLRDGDSLISAAQTGASPLMLNAYEYNGGLCVPTGSLSLRLADNQFKQYILNEAASLGLKQIDEDGPVLTLGVDHNSPCTVFEAVNQLSREPGVDWCEPDLLVDVVRYGY